MRWEILVTISDMKTASGGTFTHRWAKKVMR